METNELRRPGVGKERTAGQILPVEALYLAYGAVFLTQSLTCLFHEKSYLRYCFNENLAQRSGKAHNTAREQKKLHTPDFDDNISEEREVVMKECCCNCFVHILDPATPISSPIHTATGLFNLFWVRTTSFVSNSF